MNRDMRTELGTSRRNMLLLTGVFAAICILLACSCSSAVDMKQEKRVLVLYSTPLDFPATEMTERGLRSTLLAESPFHIQLLSEYLSLTQFRDQEQRNALSLLLKQRYEKLSIDLIISVDVPAARFLLDYAESVFPSIPIVMCEIPDGVADLIRASPLHSRTFAIFDPTVAEDLITTALSLRPGARHIALVSGAIEADTLRAQGLRKSIESHEKNVVLIDLAGLSIGDLIDKTKQLPPDTVIIFSTYFVDGRGRSYIPRDILKIMSEITHVPIFGIYESYLGNGIVGGNLISFERIGKRAGEATKKILGGARPDSVPFEYGTDTYIKAYDWRELKRWKISEDKLPDDSIVRFREHSTWDLYKGYIVGAVSLVLLEALLIVTLVINLQKRRRAEIALRGSRQELKTLAGRLISSQEEELCRLAREIHDDLVQRLAALAIEAGTLELRNHTLDDDVLQAIRRLKLKLIGLSEDVNAIARQLHPAILDDLGLARAVDALRVAFADRENIPVSLSVHNLPAFIPKEIALCLYRVVQEGIRNISKHSKAQHAEISLTGSEHAILLRVKDDGVGFILQGVRKIPGIGLASMRERVQYVNGQFSVASEIGQGTTIEVSVPVKGEAG